jgi:hypothetical protein
LTERIQAKKRKLPKSFSVKPWLTLRLRAVANVVMDAKLSVIDDLITFLESKIEVDDDLKGILRISSLT